MGFRLANIGGRAALVDGDHYYDIETFRRWCRISPTSPLTTGDLISTGTPDGIGMSQGKLLRDGDMITSTIQDLGTMTNRCVRISDYKAP